MKTKISIPDTVADMDVSHLPFYLALAKLKPEDGEVSPTLFEDMEPTEVSDLNALFFGEETGSFDIYDNASNRQILAEIAKSCNTHDPGDVAPEITIGDITYIFQNDYSKQATCFHRDISLADFKEYPLDLVAFCYVEKDMVYNELDVNKNILNPRRDRGEAFRDHFNLQQYLDLRDFFLDSYTVLRPYLKLKEARRKRSRGIGKKA